MVELPRMDHDPWVGDVAAVVAVVSPFLAHIGAATP
jgi:hypothetical protein